MEDKTQNEEQSPQDGPDYQSARFWIRRCKETEKTFKSKLWNAAKEGWSEYELGDAPGDAAEEGTGKKIRYAKLFPIYWSSIKTIAPAYWSKIPIPLAPVRYGVNDPTARTGSKLIERLGRYALETTALDQVMRDSTIEFIISDVVTTRGMLEGDRKTQQVPILPGQVEGEYRLQDGQPYQGEMVGQDEITGQWFGEQEYYENIKCYPMALSYDDVMWTPEASCEDEIDEMYYRFCYSEIEAYEMFPDVDKETLRAAMKHYGRQQDNDNPKTRQRDSDGTTELYLHGWEIWHKPTKTVKFICPNCSDDILKDSPDTYRLRNFFPSPCPIIGTKQRKSMFGVPSYRYVKEICEQMHDIALRVYNLSQAIRSRFVVDKAVENDLHSLINDADESEYIFIKGLMDIVEKGGINNVIQALPTGDLSNSLIQLSQLFEKYKQEFYEIYGVPDVLRGASDPLETAKAQEIKSFAASNRFRDSMNQVAALGRDTLEILIDLMLGAYQPEEILKKCAAQYMDKSDKERIQPAMQLILNDEDRLIRIDFETDSTSYINEAIDQQNRTVAIQTVTHGLESLNGMSPKEKAIGFKIIQSALAGMRLGKDYMDEIEEMMQALMEEAKNPPEPQPDIEMIKVQLAGQESKMKAFFQNRELDQKEAKLVQDSQSNQVELQIKAKDVEIKQYRAAIEQSAVEYEAKFKTISLALEDVTARFMMAMEQNKLGLEEFKAMAQAIKSGQEEVRLGRESIQRMVEAVGNFEQRLEPPVVNIPEQQSPQINLELIMPEKKTGGKRRRKVQPVDDGMGNFSFIVDDEDVL